jgi:hypothetical protein
VVTELGITTDVSPLFAKAFTSMIFTFESRVSAPLHLLPSIATPLGITREYVAPAPQEIVKVSALAGGANIKLMTHAIERPIATRLMSKG